MKEDLKLVKYYMLKPSIKTFGGIEVKEDTKFETTNDDGTVKQKLENLVLTTLIEQEVNEKDENGKEYHTKEEIKLTSTIPVGSILIWRENQGYTIIGSEMCTIEEGKRIINQLYKITKDIK
jgi:hypothetical protein